MKRHQPRTTQRLTTLTVLFASHILLVSCSLQEASSSNQASAILIQASFEPAWFQSDQWTLTVHENGSISATGKIRLRRRGNSLPPSALSDLTEKSSIVYESVKPGVYTSQVEDADRIVLLIRQKGREHLYTIEDPAVLACSPELLKAAKLWDFLLENVAPNTVCNGVSCLFCK